MVKDSIKDIQKKIGATPDGEFGPKSQAACETYLKSLMPNPHPWPSPDDSSMKNFFGNDGQESNLELVDGTLQLYFNTLTNLLKVRESAFSDLSITLAVSNAMRA